MPKILFLLLLLLPQLALAAPKAAPFAYCKSGKPALIPVELGGVRYNLPAELNPSLRQENGKSIQFPSGFFCVPKDAPDVKDVGVQKIDRIYVKGYNLTRSYDRNPKMHPINFYIKTRHPSNQSIPAEFCDLKQRLQKHVSWSPYPKNAAFQLGTNHSDYSESTLTTPNYLYSSQHRFLGLPIILKCWDVHGQKTSRSCTFEQRLTPETSIWVGLMFSLVSEQELGAAFKQLEVFLQTYSDHALPVHHDIPCNLTIGN